MDSNELNQEVGNSINEEPFFVGAQLKLAREKARLSLGDVSTQLLITKKRLSELESDNYEQLPAKVFVVGYIKKYAALLKLDEKSLIDAYENNCANTDSDDQSFLVSESPAKITLDKNIFGKHQSPPKWIIPALVFGMAFAVLLGTMFFTGDKEPEKLKTPEKIKTIVDEIVVENAESVSAIQGEQTDTKIEAVNLDSVNVVDVGDAVKNTVVENSPAAQKRIDSLSFSFAEECWLNVKEVEGNVIYSGTATAGSTINLEGRGPFEIMVGNAAAASLLVNGEPVSIEPQPGRKTAKLSVGG